MASIDSATELEARALEFVKDAEKQLEAAEKKTALLREKLGKEAQAHDQELRKKLDQWKPWLTFDQDLMRKLNLMKKGQTSQR